MNQHHDQEEMRILKSEDQRQLRAANRKHRFQLSERSTSIAGAEPRQFEKGTVSAVANPITRGICLSCPT